MGDAGCDRAVLDGLAASSGGGGVGIFRRQVPPQRKELVTMFFSDVVTIPPCPRPASAPASLDSLFPTAAGHLD